MNAAPTLPSGPAGAGPALDADGARDPETEVLRLVSRPRLAPPHAEALAARIREGVDWDRLLALATDHRLLPLLYAHLRDHAQADADAPTLALLRQAALRRAADVAFLSSEMAAIGERFARDGIPYLVLKGPTLSEAYGSNGLRPYSDNDLLVRRRDFPSVEAALLGMGFRQRKRSDRQQSAYLAIHGEYTFGRADGPFVSTVDVHTRLVPMGFEFSPSFDDVASRSRAIEVAGRPVPVLSWEDLFLALSVNALKDQWSHLRLAADLAAVSEMVGDWGEVRARARAGRHRRGLLLSVLVTERLVGGGFPPDLVRAAQADRRAVRLADLACAHLGVAGLDQPLSLLDRSRLNVSVQDGAVPALRYVLYTALRRTLGVIVTPPGKAKAT